MIPCENQFHRLTTCCVKKDLLFALPKSPAKQFPSSCPKIYPAFGSSLKFLGITNDTQMFGMKEGEETGGFIPQVYLYKQANNWHFQMPSVQTYMRKCSISTQVTVYIIQ